MFNALEDAPLVPVVVHAELEEMAQKSPALRDAKGERMADSVSSVRAPSAIIGFGVLWRSAWYGCVGLGHAAEPGRTGGPRLPIEHREASRRVER
jgi:hypothetical protein